MIDKPMKVKLTKEQIESIKKQYVADYFSGKDEVTIEIAPDQIGKEEMKELSNREKWEVVLAHKLVWDFGPINVATILDKNGYNADAAYRAVVGGK